MLKCSDVELLDIVLLVFEMLGKSPTMGEYNEYIKEHPELNLPSCGVIRYRFGGWNKIKERLGIDIKHEHFADKQLLDSLKDVTCSLKKTLSMKDYCRFREKHPELSLPNYFTITERFGSWTKAKNNLERYMDDEYLDDEQLLGSLEYIIGDLGKFPNVTEYKTFRETNSELNLPSYWVIRDRFGGWNKIKELLGLEIGTKCLDYAQLLISLDYVTCSLDKSPTVNDYRIFRGKHPELNLPHHSTIITKFGSWNRSKEMSGLELETKCLEDEQLLLSLDYVTCYLNKSPSIKDYRLFRKRYSELNLPSPMAIITRFGSWNKAKTELELNIKQERDSGDALKSFR